MIQTKGQVSSANQIVVRRAAAIGDVIAASCVIDKLIDLGYDPVYQAMSAIHCVLRRHPRLRHFEEPSARIPDVNLDGAYERHPLRRRMHFSTLFMERANEQLARFGINLGPASNCKPALRLHPTERMAAQNKVKDYPKPWVFICPRSETYPCRTVPDGIWQEIAGGIQGTKFWMGRHQLAPANCVDLNITHLDNLIIWLSAADLLVTVDTGPMHIAAALGIPILALGQSSSPNLHLSDQRDFMAVQPEKLDCLNCQQNACPIPNRKDNPPCQNFRPELVSYWVNQKLQQLTTENVSAVVPVYGSKAETIQHCLECLLPQVQEIVVTAETDDKVPKGIPDNPKIRVVVKGVKGIGYGRNANFGARHTTGKYLLLLNDDVFLNPNAVQGLRAAMKPGVGMVSNILRYPDGTIYHAGKRRTPGERGWAHIDYKCRDCTTKQVIELENCCGACVLVRRQAFYDCGGFDEDFFIYAEDDAFALQLRRSGWKIMFTPFSEGVHMEHQSTQKLGNIMDAVKRANTVFDKKWGRYFSHNKDNSFGNFDY